MTWALAPGSGQVTVLSALAGLFVVKINELPVPPGCILTWLEAGVRTSCELKVLAPAKVCATSVTLCRTVAISG